MSQPVKSPKITHLVKDGMNAILLGITDNRDRLVLYELPEMIVADFIPTKNNVMKNGYARPRPATCRRPLFRAAAIDIAKQLSRNPVNLKWE